MYLAMRLAAYKNGMPLDTVEQRRAAYVGSIGAGFDVEDVMRSRERGLGLFGMQERLALVGGQLVIDSSPGHGTRIHARVPSHAKTGL